MPGCKIWVDGQHSHCERKYHRFVLHCNIDDIGCLKWLTNQVWKEIGPHYLWSNRNCGHRNNDVGPKLLGNHLWQTNLRFLSWDNRHCNASFDGGVGAEQFSRLLWWTLLPLICNSDPNRLRSGRLLATCRWFISTRRHSRDSDCLWPAYSILRHIAHSVVHLLQERLGQILAFKWQKIRSWARDRENLCQCQGWRLCRSNC